MSPFFIISTTALALLTNYLYYSLSPSGIQGITSIMIFFWCDLLIVFIFYCVHLKRTMAYIERVLRAMQLPLVSFIFTRVPYLFISRFSSVIKHENQVRLAYIAMLTTLFTVCGFNFIFTHKWFAKPRGYIYIWQSYVILLTLHLGNVNELKKLFTMYSLLQNNYKSLEW